MAKKLKDSEHTPAPWRKNGDCHVCGPQKQPTTICATVYRPADAVLITAAPELLAELEDAARFAEELARRHAPDPQRTALYRGHADRWRAVIAKAKGEQ